MRTYGIKECAEFLKVSTSTAAELAVTGELPGARVGHAWVFLEEDLVCYLQRIVREQQTERQAIYQSQNSPLSAEIDVKRRRKLHGRKSEVPLLPAVEE